MSSPTKKKIQFDVEESPVVEQPHANDKAAPSKDLSAILHQTKAGDIPYAKQKAVVEVRADMTALESAKTLWDADILGAPVWDDNKQAYVGFFDMRDFLSTVLMTEKMNRTTQEGTDDAWIPPSSATSCLAARNPFIPLYNIDSSLFQVCQALSQENAHQVPLIDPKTNRCVRILSQSAVTKFLAQQLTAAQFPTFTQTLAEAKFPYLKPVIQAVETSSARGVFTLMERNRLSGIAIVDEATGKLVGNTSAVDIKLATRLNDRTEETEKRVDMNMNIISYMSVVRQEEILADDRYPSACVRESSTVYRVLQLLAKTGFHRIFVVDEDTRPIGVISVTDMVRFVVSQFPTLTKT